MFLFFKTQKRHHTVSENIQRNVRFKVLTANAEPCGYFNAISKKHLRYSLFVKRIIAIEAQLYVLGLVRLWDLQGMTVKNSQSQVKSLLAELPLDLVHFDYVEFLPSGFLLKPRANEISLPDSRN